MKPTQLLLLGVLGALSLNAVAQEAVIRKNLSERMPKMPKIEEISKTPMPGLYEVRVAHSHIFYTDEQGNYLIDGSVLDTRNKTNLTEQRLQKLTAIDYKALPFKDALTIVRGNGSRKMAIFEDPNCGYCKRFERDLAKINNVTVHVFLYPILSADSANKSRDIWCAKDKGKAFLDWMVRDVVPPAAQCDTSALARNVEFGQKFRISGTPTSIFPNGVRESGAVTAARLEKLLGPAKP